MFRRTAIILVLMLVMSGTTTILISNENYIAKAEQWPNYVNATIANLTATINARFSNLSAKMNATFTALRELTINGSMNLANLSLVQRQILYGLIDKYNNYILQNGTLNGPRGNSTFANTFTKLQLLLTSNATMAGKIDRILHCIAGNNTLTNWNLFQLSNEILFGLIDKDNRYILHNGTLAFPHGNSAMLISLQNDVVISEMIKAASALQRNDTQQIVSAGDSNKNTLTTNLNDMGKTTVNSVGNLQWWLAAILVILVLLTFYMVYLRERLRRYSPRLKYPQCYGEPRVFDSTGACQGCKLKEDCERSIIATTANLQAQEEAITTEQPKKKKMGLGLLKRNREPIVEAEEPVEDVPQCFGKYLAGDKECTKCSKAMECMDETPGVKPARQDVRQRQQQPASGSFDPLAGM
jgi:hypothetical protein